MYPGARGRSVAALGGVGTVWQILIPSEGISIKLQSGNGVKTILLML